MSEKNKDFDRTHPLTDQQKKEVLKSLTTADRVGIAENDNPMYEEAEIYKFISTQDLIVYGEQIQVKLHIKMYITLAKFDEMVIVISFHKEGMYD